MRQQPIQYHQSATGDLQGHSTRHVKRQRIGKIQVFQLSVYPAKALPQPIVMLTW